MLTLRILPAPILLMPRGYQDFSLCAAPHLFSLTRESVTGLPGHQQDAESGWGWTSPG